MGCGLAHCCRGGKKVGYRLVDCWRGKGLIVDLFTTAGDEKVGYGLVDYCTG